MLLQQCQNKPHQTRSVRVQFFKLKFSLYSTNLTTPISSSNFYLDFNFLKLSNSHSYHNFKRQTTGNDIGVVQHPTSTDNIETLSPSNQGFNCRIPDALDRQLNRLPDSDTIWAAILAIWRLKQCDGPSAEDPNWKRHLRAWLVHQIFHLPLPITHHLSSYLRLVTTNLSPILSSHHSP